MTETWLQEGDNQFIYFKDDLIIEFTRFQSLLISFVKNYLKVSKIDSFALAIHKVFAICGKLQLSSIKKKKLLPQRRQII